MLRLTYVSEVRDAHIEKKPLRFYRKRAFDFHNFMFIVSLS